MSIADIVDLVHPSVSGVAVPTNDEIWVLFDREIDETTVAGNIFVTGPDQDTWSGPDLALYQTYESVGTEDQVLQSPDFAGIVQGTFTFERIQNASLAEYVGYDYTGAGTNYRTKAIFTPTRALSADTSYRIYVSGDEDPTDALITGIRTRSVFDTVIGANVGSGTASFGGSYTGAASSDSYYVEISTAGEPGTSRFDWYIGSAPATLHGPYPTSLSPTLLSDGVTITFSAGTYEVGDAFSCIVREPTTYSGNLTWPFETGSGSIQALPSTASTTLFGTPIGTSAAVTTFEVEETVPADQATNLNIVGGAYSISVAFNDTIDPTTITSSTVTVNAEAVNGDTMSGITFSGLLPVNLSTSGEDLTITIPAGMLFENNVVTVTLDSVISSTSGNSLAEDYTFYFTTKYAPLYSSVRKIRLDIGAYVQNVPDDTINFAIFEASLEADFITFGDATTVTAYYEFIRRQWTTCRAEEILLTNLLNAGGGLKRKKLADLEVEYDPKAIGNALDRALGCLAKLTPALNARGLAVQTPVGFIKGELDPDRPAVGRLWNNVDLNDFPTPAANARSKALTSRRYRSGYYSRWNK